MFNFGVVKLNKPRFQLYVFCSLGRERTDAKDTLGTRLGLNKNSKKIKCSVASCQDFKIVSQEETKSKHSITVNIHKSNENFQSINGSAPFERMGRFVNCLS